MKAASLHKTGYFLKLLREAADFYDETSGYEIAYQFLVAVDAAISRIVQNPHCGPRYLPPDGFAELAALHYRQLNLAGLSRFPYTLYYEIEPERIVIQALFHHSRNRERLLVSQP